LRTAERTRSFASETAASGSPTIAKNGKPGEISTSTSTMVPSSPIRAQLEIFVNIDNMLRESTLCVNCQKLTYSL